MNVKPEGQYHKCKEAARTDQGKSKAKTKSKNKQKPNINTILIKSRNKIKEIKNSTITKHRGILS
jgi:hypothetical protein